MANVTRYKTSKGEARYRVRYRKPDGTQTDKGDSDAKAMPSIGRLRA